MTTTMTANRILDAAAVVRKSIADGKRLDGRPLAPGGLDDLREGLALTLVEHVAYQNAQAFALASGRITADEAMTIYAALGGEVPGSDQGWDPSTDLALRVVVTQAMGALIGLPQTGD